MSLIKKAVKNAVKRVLTAQELSDFAKEHLDPVTREQVAVAVLKDPRSIANKTVSDAAATVAQNDLHATRDAAHKTLSDEDRKIAVLGDVFLPEGTRREKIAVVQRFLTAINGEYIQVVVPETNPIKRRAALGKVVKAALVELNGPELDYNQRSLVVELILAI